MKHSTFFKSLLSIMLAALMFVGAIPLASVSVSAATSSQMASTIAANLPIATYAMPLSGASKVYSYNNSSLSKRTTNYWIASFKDPIVITKISNDGKAVYVTYPSSSSSTGRRSRWFSTDDIVGVASVNIQNYKASNKFTAYRMSSAASLCSYGYIDKNDLCVRLGTHKIGTTTYGTTIYPIPSTKINGVSGIKHKLALVPITNSTNNSNTTSSNTSVVAASSWQMPMSGYWVTQAFNNKTSSGSRPYHCGIDIKSSNTKVYAAATGIVVYKGRSSGNGYHVVLAHNVNGTTVKTLYSHLANYNSCPAVGKTVSKGTQIGVMGNSGNSTGPHLHFAIYTGSSNNPYGYASRSGANKISYAGCVFFNPVYVVTNNGKLP